MQGGMWAFQDVKGFVQLCVGYMRPRICSGDVAWDKGLGFLSLLCFLPACLYMSSWAAPLPHPSRQPVTMETGPLARK